MRKCASIISFFLIIVFLVNGCAPLSSSPPAAANKSKTPLVVFAAGSLIIPFNDLKKAFESKYPSIEVQPEYHGSIQVIRQCTDIHQKIDVIATADDSLIPMLMYTVNDSETGKPYANWYLRFATNRLALAYNPQSNRLKDINQGNWYDLISRSDVKVGIPDPRFDPTGYRALMALALAQDYYHDPKIFTNVINGRFRNPITIFQDDDLTTITVPEIVETNSGSNIVVRGASIELIALLESGDLDYAFEYESVIQQHGLKMIRFPDAINLGANQKAGDYSKVQVNMDFQRFATVKPKFKGAQIGYGMTIPSNAPHPQEAALFIAFLLSPEGRAIMEKDFNPMYASIQADHYQQVPVSLQKLSQPGAIP